MEIQKKESYSEPVLGSSKSLSRDWIKDTLPQGTVAVIRGVPADVSAILNSAGWEYGSCEFSLYFAIFCTEFMTPNMAMSGGGARSAEESAPLAG